MKEIRYTLITDGSSDDALIPILTWLLREQGISLPIVGNWADLSRLPRRPTRLAERIKQALNLFPCELLFVHRDAENQPPDRRHEEIQESIDALNSKISLPPVIKVVPVRMTEAWVLIDEAALRWVAENPNGRMPIELPRPQGLEAIPDPKALLQERLRQASEKRGRRLKRFSKKTKSSRLIADRIESFALLRFLPAFRTLEAELSQVIQEHGWKAVP